MGETDDKALIELMEAALAPAGTRVERASQVIKLAPAEKHRKSLDVAPNVDLALELHVIEDPVSRLLEHV